MRPEYPHPPCAIALGTLSRDAGEGLKRCMFRKILIANRGEIACRVIRTARRMGIATVAVYSEADAEALHVREADEAVPIGPAPSAESYLRDRPHRRGLPQTGAEAVHPGYGFLSERPAFADGAGRGRHRLHRPDARRRSPRWATRSNRRSWRTTAGVSTVPGLSRRRSPMPSARCAIARDIGYPVMIKASAGGGGKGMRIAHDDAELRDGFASAQHEAKSSFGDDRIFLEKYIEEPRHIEIQVLGDAHGNIVHLGERECSIQRRHQKVIEEAPSPFLDAATRAAMGGAGGGAGARRRLPLGRHGRVHRRPAAQFLLPRNEHAAAGRAPGDRAGHRARPGRADDPHRRRREIAVRPGRGAAQTGWAIEARVYAEDPQRNFLPSIGRLVRYRPPEGDGIRVDTGVFEGAEITLYYDPMIAKLIAYGARPRPGDRAAARRARRLLHRRACGTTSRFSRRSSASARFRRGPAVDRFHRRGIPRRLRAAA